MHKENSISFEGNFFDITTVDIIATEKVKRNYSVKRADIKIPCEHNDN